MNTTKRKTFGKVFQLRFHLSIIFELFMVLNVLNHKAYRKLKRFEISIKYIINCH